MVAGPWRRRAISPPAVAGTTNTGSVVALIAEVAAIATATPIGAADCRHHPCLVITATIIAVSTFLVVVVGLPV